MHNASFYKVSAAAFPIFLLAFGRVCGRALCHYVRHGCLHGFEKATLCIIPLFPAEPKLGPIWNHFDHYQGFAFPLLLVVPALAMDWLLNRYAYERLGWAALYECCVCGVNVGRSMAFGGFLQESYRNWFLKPLLFLVMTPIGTPTSLLRGFCRVLQEFVIGIAYAIGFGYVSSRIDWRGENG